MKKHLAVRWRLGPSGWTMLRREELPPPWERVDVACGRVYASGATTDPGEVTCGNCARSPLMKDDR